MRDDLIARLQPHEWRYLRGIASDATTLGTEIDVGVLRRLLRAIDALSAPGETRPASEDNGSGFCVQCCLPMGSHRLQCPRDVQPAASPLPAAEGLELARATAQACYDELVDSSSHSGLVDAWAIVILTALRAVAEGRR